MILKRVYWALCPNFLKSTDTLLEELEFLVPDEKGDIILEIGKLSKGGLMSSSAANYQLEELYSKHGLNMARFSKLVEQIQKRK